MSYGAGALPPEAGLRDAGFLWLALALHISAVLARIPEVTPLAQSLPVIRLTGILVLAAFAVQCLPRGGLSQALEAPEARWALAIGIIAVAGVPFSLWPGGSFSFIADSFGKTLLIFFILQCCCQGLRDTRLLVDILLAAGTILVLAALIDKGWSHRLAITRSYDPNDLAALLAALIPLALFQLKARPSLTGYLAIPWVLAALFIIVQTRSRGGFLGAVLVLLLYLRRSQIRYKLAIAALAVGLFLVVAPGSYWTRMGTILSPQESMVITTETGAKEYLASGGGRLDAWNKGLNRMIESPVLGMGIHSFFISRQEDQESSRWKDAHNIFIQTGAELGLPGLLAFLALLRAAFKRLKALTYAEDPLSAELARSLRYSLLAYVVTGFFLSQAYSLLLYLLVAAGTGLGRQARGLA